MLAFNVLWHFFVDISYFWILTCNTHSSWFNLKRESIHKKKLQHGLVIRAQISVCPVKKKKKPVFSLYQVTASGLFSIFNHFNSEVLILICANINLPPPPHFPGSDLITTITQDWPRIVTCFNKVEHIRINNSRTTYQYQPAIFACAVSEGFIEKRRETEDRYHSSTFILCKISFIFHTSLFKYLVIFFLSRYNQRQKENLRNSVKIKRIG